MSPLPEAASRMREFTALSAGRPVGQGRHGAGPAEGGSCAQLPPVPAQHTAFPAPTGGWQGSSRVYFLSQNPKHASSREPGEKPGGKSSPLSRILEKVNSSTKEWCLDCANTSSPPPLIFRRACEQWPPGQQQGKQAPLRLPPLLALFPTLC